MCICQKNRIYVYKMKMGYVLSFEFEQEFCDALADALGLFYLAPEVVKAALVGAAGNPEFEIALGAVFLMEVVQGALDVLFGGKGGVVGESVLDGAAEDCFGLDVAVGLVHERP